MTYADAMARYGTDKPDLRFGLELTDLTEYFASTPFRVFQAEYVGAVVMPGGASQPRRTLDGWQDWAKSRGARGLAYVLIQEDGTLTGPVAKNLSEEELAGLAEKVGANPGDCVFFAAGETGKSRQLLGAARLEIAARLDRHRCIHDADLWHVDQSHLACKFGVQKFGPGADRAFDKVRADAKRVSIEHSWDQRCPAGWLG